MSRISALGWVARTVLISGSSTGLTPPPRVAPSRASRRRTAAPPVVPGRLGGGTGAALRPGAVGAPSSPSPVAAATSGGSGLGEVTSAPARPVIVTSPATCAPVVRQASSLPAVTPAGGQLIPGPAPA